MMILETRKLQKQRFRIMCQEH